MATSENVEGIPVLRYSERASELSAIYAWLGGATKPRHTRRHNPLRLLPRELVLRVAQFAFVPGFSAGWSGVGDGREDLAVEVDVASSPAAILRMPPIRGGVNYVEVQVARSWYGTRLFLEHERPGANPDWFGVELRKTERTEVQVTPQIEGVDLFHFDSTYNRLFMYTIPAFCGEWQWGEAVAFGALVDVPRRCVTFCLNGVVGPCVRFPACMRLGDIRLVCDYFPDYPPDEWHGRRSVSCATLSTPASMLDVRPETCAQHHALGTLIKAPNMAARVDDFLEVHPPGGGGQW